MESFSGIIQIDRQLHVHGIADHAFMDYTSHRYKQDAEQLSRPRTLDLFATHPNGGANN